MSYEWSNQKRLENLDVSSNEGILNFETPAEKAKIFLKDNDIDKVLYDCGDVAITITPKDAKSFVVTSGGVTRDVVHYLLPDGPAKEMRLGVTHHRGVGSWSSLPHDFELNPEPGFEEVFFYMLDGGSRRAVQVGKGVWNDYSTVDDIWTVHDKTFSTIPMGYHPVVGEPGVAVSYIWIYLCKHKHWEKV